MPSNNYAGKPFPRHYAPAAPRIFPDGTQSISAYTAPLAFYDNTAGGYSSKIGNRNNIESKYQVLLFGSDYPAIVSGCVEYRDCHNSIGTPLIPSIITQNFSLNGVDGSNKPYFEGFQNYQNTNFKYQQLVTGTTVTNEVKIGGFSTEVTIPFNGVYNFTDGGIPLVPASQIVTFNALMNGGNAAASSMFGKLNIVDFAVTFRIPIILWEYDFKPYMKEQQMTFSDTYISALGGDPIPSVFDVVGIWFSDTPPYL
jgi:hypothetical protein